MAAGTVYLMSPRLLRAADPDDLRTLSKLLGSFPRPRSLLGEQVLRLLDHLPKQSGPQNAHNRKDNLMISPNRLKQNLTVNATAGQYAQSGRATRGLSAFRASWRRTIIRALFALSFLAAGLAPKPGHTDDYRLSSDDKINLRVVEWRQGEAAYKEWEVLTGIYPVSDGKISVPLAGEFVAEGKTTAEISKAIAEGLQKQTGLLNAPSVSVNIESYGSIYVMGDVQHPGEFPYSRDMTVLRAVSIAGGFFRKADLAFMRLDRDRIVSSGELEDAELDYTRLLVRQARLEAELEGKNEFETPAEFRDNPKAAAIAKEERSFMTARSSALRSKLDTLVDLQTLSEQEIATLEDKIKSQHLQIQLSTEELKGVTSLFQKGLAVSSRQLALQRELADAELKLLDLEIASVRSKQILKKAERDGQDLRSTQLADIQKELQEVRPKLEHARVQMRTSALLISEAAITTPAILAARENETRPEPTFTLVRELKGGSRRTSASADARLRPRDIVEVVLEYAPTAGTSAGIPPGN